MSIGIVSDFKVYPEQFWGGAVETLQQNVDVFNAASAGCLQLVTRNIKGDYEKEQFFKLTSNIVQDRDNTSTADVTEDGLASDEFSGIKVNKRIGPKGDTLDKYRKVSKDPGEFSVILGQQTGVAIAADYVQVAIGVANASIACAGTTALTKDITSDTLKTLNHTSLIDAMALFGDAASRLRCFVMHSKSYFDLMKQQVADKLYEVAGATVYAGTVATFGKPVVVTDSTSLIIPGGSSSNKYVVLGLTEGAVEVAESEEKQIVSQLITGKANLFMRIQGEYAYNVRAKGCAFDTSKLNPSFATLTTSGNWTKKVSDLKSMGGVRLITL